MVSPVLKSSRKIFIMLFAHFILFFYIKCFSQLQNNYFNVSQKKSRMDPKIAALKKAENSAQFKAAVDGIGCEWKYFSEARDVILQQQNLIVDAPTADAVVSFLRKFSEIPRDPLRTAEIRDLIVDVLAPKISAGESVEKLGRTICNIVQNKPAGELYSNRKSFSAILDCFHRAPTAESAFVIPGSINNICNSNPGANKILNDLPVVEACCAIIPYATTDDSVRWISDFIDEILTDNEPASKMFGTPAF